MKKNYETANMEITYLQESDIIATSGITTDLNGTANTTGDNYGEFGSLK